METLSTLRGRVRVRVDEASAQFWADTDLDQWINEAARDIARRSETLQATTEFDATADTQEYTLPTDVIKVHRAEYANNTDRDTVTPLEYRDYNTMDSVWWSQQVQSRGDPYWFTMWGFPPSLKMVVYPTPSDTVTNGFKVFYYRLPAAATTDGDNIEIPQGWEDLAEDYCEYMALRKDGDPRWQEAKQLYEQKIDGFIDMTRRWTDQAGVVATQHGPVPAWLYGGGEWY